MEQVAKKPKSDPMLNAVIEAIRQADIAPESCKDMLIAIVPTTLAIPLDVRHEHQQMAVEMIGEILQGHKSKLQEALACEASSVEHAEVSKADFARKEQAAQEHLAEVVQKFKSQKLILADLSKTLLGLRTALEDELLAQSKSDTLLAEGKSQKEEYETAMTKHLLPVMNDDIDETQSMAHFQALHPLFSKLGVEESLIHALPTGFSKKPSERSAFDNMALKTLEESLCKNTAQALEVLEERAAAADKCAVAVAAAKAAFEEAKSPQQDAAKELSVQVVAKEEAEAAYKTAMAATVDYQIEYNKITAIREQKKDDLAAFESYSVECYNMLRDKKSKMSDVKEAEGPAEGTNREVVSAGGA